MAKNRSVFNAIGILDSINQLSSSANNARIISGRTALSASLSELGGPAAALGSGPVNSLN